MGLATRCAAAMAAALCAGTALAQEPQPYAERYARTCAPCHGGAGVSALPLTPSLAGQPAFYAITQLFLFREGRRDSAAMTAVAREMSNDDLRGYSEHIGKLPPPQTSPADADALRMERGAALTQRLHCTGCHGSDLAGGRQVPRLALQREDYLLHALRGFRAGSRVGYTPAMTEALAGVSPAELEDMAHYLARGPAAKAP
ncbi:MAG: c-type cytochrome [Rubrivivax sp.]|nr:c-type cytochrome [Rubrivivax sp.]